MHIITPHSSCSSCLRSHCGMPFDWHRSLSKNRLIGSIPSEFSSLTSLSTMCVGTRSRLNSCNPSIVNVIRVWTRGNAAMSLETCLFMYKYKYHAWAQDSKEIPSTCMQYKFSTYVAYNKWLSDHLMETQNIALTVGSCRPTRKASVFFVFLSRTTVSVVTFNVRSLLQLEFLSYRIVW